MNLVEQAAEGKQSPMTLTDQMRHRFKGVLDPVGAFFNRLGFLPNQITFLGLVGNTIGAILIARGNMLLGGLVVLLMGPVDALDGTMARLRGEASEFGAFVDSVTDRYSEMVIYAGLLYYFLQQNEPLYVFITYLAAAGSVLVSYTRARAQSLGHETKVGILTRMERYMVLAPGLVFNLPRVSLWILAVLANLTAVQRILDVRRKAYKQRKPS